MFGVDRRENGVGLASGERREAEKKKAVYVCGGGEGSVEFQEKTRLLARFLNLRHRRKRTAVEELNVIGIIEKSCSIMFEG